MVMVQTCVDEDSDKQFLRVLDKLQVIHQQFRRTTDPAKLRALIAAEKPLTAELNRLAECDP